jgi:hypothetical protein
MSWKPNNDGLDDFTMSRPVVPTEQLKRKPFAVPDAAPDEEQLFDCAKPLLTTASALTHMHKQGPSRNPIICRKCGEVIPGAGRRQLRCYKCSRILHYENEVRRLAALVGKPRLCVKCGEKFETTGAVQKLCRACRYAHNQNRLARKPDRTAYALSMLRVGSQA